MADHSDIVSFVGQGWHIVLEDAPPAVVIVNDEGNVMWANRAFVTLFGYARPEVVGKQVNFLLPEERRLQHADFISGWFAHPRPRPMGADLNIQGRNRNGEIMALEIQLSPIETDKGLLALAWIRERTA